MAVKKIVEPTVTDATMADIITLINDKFTSSDKYSKLQFDAIQLQLKIVTTDIANVRAEVKDINAKLVLIDKADAIHYLACPNTLQAPKVETMLAEFPAVKDVTDELTIMRKWFKPTLITSAVAILVAIITFGVTIFKVQPEVNILQDRATVNAKNIQSNTNALTEEQLRQINGILHKGNWDKENTTIKP